MHIHIQLSAPLLFIHSNAAENETGKLGNKQEHTRRGEKVMMENSARPLFSSLTPAQHARSHFVARTLMH
jgi:hypothetical protein